MKYILNIGREVAEQFTLLSVSDILESLRSVGFDIQGSLLASSTEPTLVVECSHPNSREVPQLVEVVSEQLYQDCIALYSVKHDTLHLFGPRAEKWLPVNRSYFVLPNGSKLSNQ